MSKKSILGSAGRFGTRYGVHVKRKIAKIESLQDRKQSCIFCRGKSKRLSKGIWLCQKCGKKFAGHAYYLEITKEMQLEEKSLDNQKKNKNTKVLKNEKASKIVDGKAEPKSKVKKQTKTK